MRLPSNIEKHPTRSGAYIAYDKDGYAFSVTRSRGSRGKGWGARPSHAAASTDDRWISDRTLTEVANAVASSSKVPS